MVEEDEKGKQGVLLSTKLVFNSASLQLSELLLFNLQRNDLCHSQENIDLPKVKGRE